MTEKRVVLVTGAGGLIGRQALAPLQRLGFEVHAVTRKSLSLDTPDGIFLHPADLLNPAETQALMQSVRPTHLLHFAWYAEPGKFWDSPLNWSWLKATSSLLQYFALAGGRRFVGAGTCAEYDWSGDVYREATTPIHPATLYGAAKAAAYFSGSIFAQTAGISFAWGRIFLVFGPGEAATRIVPSLIRAHLSGQPLDCSQGTQLRDFLPVLSTAEAFAHLLAGNVQSAVNIASGRGVSLYELSEQIAALVGRKAEIRFGAFKDPGPARLVPEVDRLTHEVGWLPPASLEPALAEAIGWWKMRA